MGVTVGYQYYDASIACRGANCDQMTLLTLGGGATYLAALLVVALAASVFVFRRREIA